MAIQEDGRHPSMAIQVDGRHLHMAIQDGRHHRWVGAQAMVILCHLRHTQAMKFTHRLTNERKDAKDAHRKMRRRAKDVFSSSVNNLLLKTLCNFLVVYTIILR